MAAKPLYNTVSKHLVYCGDERMNLWKCRTTCLVATGEWGRECYVKSSRTSPLWQLLFKVIKRGRDSAAPKESFPSESFLAEHAAESKWVVDMKFQAFSVVCSCVMC